ncbi:TOMM system kinase/cyclase fusion protein [Chitinophaga varians]|uniref:TOMM system kinase/cyclase fusion protein n=1 Tax=Chitinophaga varians TaxID=2202339 RepID=UPI00165F5996|nr:TOMM system kinase/cyclase fusion protein [Chitinophaga varians]MBC9913881.1 TOMM system kinase/cyclase fusion protein [Chitinophaga varians]
MEEPSEHHPFPSMEYYNIVEVLCDGMHSSVYKAVQKATRQYVAIKLIKGHLLSGRQLQERFDREVRICAEINHPYIVKLLDTGYTGDHLPFVVFEYIAGITLKQFLQQEGAINLPLAVELMGQVLDALACAHGMGIVHRDLKPENIMITQPGARPYAKVLDFGIGAFMGDSFPVDDTAGTPAYCAPEQLRGEPPTTRSDLYAWGLLLTECITGTPVVNGLTAAAVYAQQLSPDPVPLPDFIVGHPLTGLLQRVLEKKAVNRAGDAHQLLQELAAMDFIGPPLTAPVDNLLKSSHTGTMNNMLAWNYEKREKRLITVLCIKLDVPGCLGTHPEEEMLEELQHRQLSTCAAIAARFGGFVKGMMADHLLIYFGYPHTTDNDARMACRTALEVLGNMQQCSLALYEQKRVVLETRQTIHTGTIISRRNRVPEGTTANTGFRLLPYTPANRILVTGSTAALIATFAELEKGHAVAGEAFLPVQETFYVLKERRAEAFSQLYAVAANRSMHGRTAALDTIIRHFEQVDVVRKKIVLVTGDAGIGKSRLLLEARKKMTAVTLMERRCLPEHRHIALFPFMEIIRQYYGLYQHAGDRIVPLLEQLLAVAGCDPAVTLPVLLSYLGFPFTDKYPPLQTAPAEQKKILFQALKKMMGNISRKKKYVLLLEDLHWMDPSSRELLADMIAGKEENGGLFLLSARTAFTPEWDSTSFTQLSLGPLDVCAARDMIEEQLGEGKKIATASLHYVMQHTDGVPFFIEELLQLLLAEGWLVAMRDTYHLVDDGRQPGVPLTLKELLHAKLDQAGGARETAQLAATIGREFSSRLLMKVAMKEVCSVWNDLQTLTAADIIVPLRTEKGLWYVFRHMLFCEVTYDSQPVPAREQAHARIAEELIAAIDPDGQPDVLAVNALAQHLYGAGNVAAAIEWQLTGIQQLISTSANRECIPLCEQALKWLRELPDDHITELAIRQYLLSNLVIVEGYGATTVGEQLDIMYRLYEQVPAQEQLLPGMFIYTSYYAMRGDWKMAAMVAQRLYEQSLALQDIKYAIVSAVFLGLQLFNDGRFKEAAAVLEKALALYDPASQDERTAAGTATVRSCWDAAMAAMEAVFRHYATAESRVQDCLRFVNSSDGQSYITETYRLLSLAGAGKQAYAIARKYLALSQQMAEKQQGMVMRRIAPLRRSFYINSTSATAINPFPTTTCLP